MNTREMLKRFRQWKEESKPLVLASVYDTAGSTYSKAGTQMLITGDGDFQGLLSGGCLEGDLAERAARVSTSGRPETVTYDLGGADDELFGLGVGCDGTMRILLQPLAPPDYQPFGAVADCLSGDRPGVLATVVESGFADMPPGGAAFFTDDGVGMSTLAGGRESLLADEARKHLRSRVSGLVALVAEGFEAAVLFASIEPPPQILVLGAGLDAVPVVDFAVRLGWRVTVRDHRPTYFEMGDFSRAERCIAEAADQLSADKTLDRFSAAVVMSHHLASDRSYLTALADSSIPYVGLLGPRKRRRQLLDDLGEAAARLEPRLHGPAGLDIGAQDAPGIALSIVAEIQAELAGKAPGGRLGAPAEGTEAVLSEARQR